MNGAPVLSGTAESLINVLDACLVNGFGLQTASSVVVNNYIATATFPSSHPFEPDTIALFSGAVLPQLNGEKRILTTTTNTVTFTVTGIANGSSAGTITARLAPAGWEKPFSGTNLAAYRSLDVESTRMYLRVDDTGTVNARVVGYETMTDVNTGTGPFPTTTQISGGGWWPKAHIANATARAWTLVADGKGFILHVHTAASPPGISGVVWEFGDFASLKSGDAYACRLQCHNADTSSASSNVPSQSDYCSNSPQAGAYLPRSFTTLGGAVAGAHAAQGLFQTSGASGATLNSPTPIYPNGPDNGLILVRKIIIEPSVCLRGYGRGLYVAPQNLHTQFNWRDKIDGQGELAGRKLLAIKCGSPAGTTSQGAVFMDITGPW